MPDDAAYFEHLRDAIAKVERYLGQVTYDEFRQNDLLLDGVVRELEIIGEAANQMSQAGRLRLPGRGLT